MKDMSVYDAIIYLVKAHGGFGAKQYVERMLSGFTCRSKFFWKEGEQLLSQLDMRQSKQIVVCQIIALRKEAIAAALSSPEGARHG